MTKIRIQQIPYIPKPKDRKPDLFYYDLRDSEIDNGYTIERNVWANNIGSIVSDTDLLKDKNYINDDDKIMKNVEWVNNLV